jgi:hypothetical protein
MLLSSETGGCRPICFPRRATCMMAATASWTTLVLSMLPEAPRHPSVDQHSAVIRKQLDWVAEAAHRIFADAFEIEIAVDEIGERAR